MPIEKVSAAQFATQISTGINNRAEDLETAYGPIPDTCIQPQAAVLETQNDRARKLSLLLTLSDASEFDGYESDLEGIVFNEGMTRSTGAPSTVTVTFYRSSAPTSDLLVQRGFPVGTLNDTSTNTSITFLTSEEATLPVASASSFFNIATQRYEISVPAVSVVTGSATRVGTGRITRALRPLGAFDGFENTTPSAGGRDGETNQELIDRYLLAVVGRQLGTASGIERLARANYPDIESMAVVYGTDPLLTRGATDGGAVDAWVKGDALLQVAENSTYLGVGQLIAVRSPPLVAVVSVQSGANTYLDEVDFEVVPDVSGVSRSTRESAGIRFLATATTPLPAVGDVVTVTYTYNNLIRALQSGFTDEEVLELGRDLLFRRGVEVPIVHTAQLRVASGYNASSILQSVTTAVSNYINGLQLGSDLEASDIQGVVRAFSGVDNYIITRNTRATVQTGVGDVAIDGNEYASITTANLSITTI